jgi:FkbH-like protein
MPGVKCLVWDLDDTLWDGNLLEGPSPELRCGVRSILEALDRVGVLQSIASVNDFAVAWAHLSSLDVAQYFLVPEIHFGDKAESIARIAAKLRTSTAEMAFIDDDPFQRARMGKAHPDMKILDARDYHALPATLAPALVTAESRLRRQYVQTDLVRDAESRQFQSLEEFLVSCELRFCGRTATPADAERLVELAQRTNRMNVSGDRPSPGDVYGRINLSPSTVLIGELHDRFGDYGTVAAAFVDQRGVSSHVTSLWISCRVGQRGFPPAWFTFLGKHAKHQGAESLVVHYKPTEANRLSAFHLGQYGFKLTAASDGRAYVLDLSSGLRHYPRWISANVGE